MYMETQGERSTTTHIPISQWTKKKTNNPLTPANIWLVSLCEWVQSTSSPLVSVSASYGGLLSPAPLVEWLKHNTWTPSTILQHAESKYVGMHILPRPSLVQALPQHYWVSQSLLRPSCHYQSLVSSEKLEMRKKKGVCSTVPCYWRFRDG